MFGKTCTSFK